MKDIKTRPTILYYNGLTYTDYSDALCDFAVDTATITILTTDAIYVGFEKPINSLFCWPTTPSTGSRTISVAMYNESYSSWDSVYLLDDTKGLTRAGFLQWELPDTSLCECFVNGLKKYWVKITVSVNTSAVVFRAISGLFSDDNELIKEFPKIMDPQFLLGQTNHLLIHETCRNDIVQHFRKLGMRRVKKDAYWSKFSHWDIMDIDEVKTAATYLALSKIFSNVANSAKSDDNWTAKSAYYRKKYSEQIDLSYLTWDKYSNGAVNEEQTRQPEVTFHR
jgi:hypothetical protein